MTKSGVLSIFEEWKVKSYVKAIMLGEITIDSIPYTDIYRTAVGFYIKYDRDWWKHIHLDAVGKCIMRVERGRKNNIGIIREIDLDSGMIYVCNKRLPEGKQNYSMAYNAFEELLDNGSYVRLILAYDKD